MSKPPTYEQIEKQLESIFEEPLDQLGRMCTMVALLQRGIDYFHWTGFYRVTRPQHLEIGPYQGPLACLNIPFDKGVCGACATSGKTIIVPDVHKFPGHIACNDATQSEIVVPVFSDSALCAVLDVDSNFPDAFDEVDQKYLEKFVARFIGSSS